MPVWAVGAGTGLLLLAAFAALRFSADQRSDAPFQALQTLDVKGTPPPAALPPPPPAAMPRLAGLLQPDIAAGQVEVRDLADRSVVVLHGNSLFDPGSDEVAAAARPLLGRIGAALAKLPGPVLVEGHTDSQPIRSLRFSSNWQLSQARAAAVRTLLAETVDAGAAARRRTRRRGAGRRQRHRRRARPQPARRDHARRGARRLKAAMTIRGFPLSTSILQDDEARR